MTLSRVGFVPVPPGGKPGFDHADVYRPGRRMYVAHTGADRVDVLDCRTHTFLHSLPDLPGVAGVLIDEEHDLLFTSDRGGARVSVFRCSDEQLLGRVAVGPHPNGLAYDRQRRRLHAFNLGEPLGENCTASVVELETLRAIDERARVGGAEEPAASEPEPMRASPPEPQSSARSRAARSRRRGSPPARECSRTRGRAPGRRAPSAAAPATAALVVLDRDSGVVASLPLPGVPDVVMHDPDLQRLYVAIGEPGLVCSFDSDRLELLETVETEPGAHTIGWDPDGRCLYVFCPASGGAIVFEDNV